MQKIGPFSSAEYDCLVELAWLEVLLGLSQYLGQMVPLELSLPKVFALMFAVGSSHRFVQDVAHAS